MNNSSSCIGCRRHLLTVFGYASISKSPQRKMMVYNIKKKKKSLNNNCMREIPPSQSIKKIIPSVIYSFSELRRHSYKIRSLQNNLLSQKANAEI